MTADPTRPTIPHAARCRRKHPPVLIAGWDGRPLIACPECGRRAPADDTREPTTTTKENHR